MNKKKSQMVCLMGEFPIVKIIAHELHKRSIVGYYFNLCLLFVIARCFDFIVRHLRRF